MDRQTNSEMEMKVLGLLPFQHLKINCILNGVVMILLTLTLSTNNWFTYKVTYTQHNQFGLRQINLGEAGGWSHYDNFRNMCTEEYLHQFQDLRDDCEYLAYFSLAGTIYTFMIVTGIIIQVYNAISSASIGWGLNLKMFEIDVTLMQFIHLLTPFTYSLGLLIWVILVHVSFTPDFKGATGLWLAITANVLDMCISIHYYVFRRYETYKSPYLNYVF